MRRRKAEVSGQEKKSGRDWLAIGISLCAISLTALNNYFTVLRKVDYVTIKFDGSFRPLNLNRGDLLELDLRLDSASIVLTKTGNRAVAITSLYLTYNQKRKMPENADSFTCSTIGMVGTEVFETDFEPVVVKDNDVV